MNRLDDEDESFARGRSFTWSHQERRSVAFSGKWASTMEDYEQNGRADDIDSAFDCHDNSSAPQQPMQSTNGKKRRKSYTEMIATAILSSPEKKLTLAEIYDWMSTHIEEYKNQRYVPSSSSWKNAVRHNLSVQSCFKRVKRHGVEKPSWWTVDVRQVAKRRLSVPLITGDDEGELESETAAGPPKKTQATVSADTVVNGSGFVYEPFANITDNDAESAEHAYSRNDQQLGEGYSGKVEFSSSVAYDGNNQQIATLEFENGSSVPISADQLAQAWLDRFKSNGSSVLAGRDGSSIQTLRVKTARGVEQNVRLMGPLRVNVVVRCEKASQTDDLGDGLAKMEYGDATDYQSGQGFEGLSRACSIDQTLISFSNDAVLDISKMLHGDVKMPSTMAVLSPTAVMEEDACWDAIGGEDLMVLSNM